MDNNSEKIGGFDQIVGRYMLLISSQITQSTSGEEAYIDHSKKIYKDRLQYLLSDKNGERLGDGGYIFFDGEEQVEIWQIFESSGAGSLGETFTFRSSFENGEDDEKVVTDAYLKILMREVDSDGFSLYSNLIAEGTLKRSEFVKILASSPESLERNGKLAIVGSPCKTLKEIDNPEGCREMSIIVASAEQ